MSKGGHGISSQMSKNTHSDIKGLNRQKEDVGDFVTETDSKLPAQKGKRTPAKHCLWIDFKAVKLDGRTALAKAINLMRRELVKHVGGSPSIAQSILIERAVHKSIKAFIYETNFFTDKEQGSKDHYLALVNSLRLDLQALGLKRSEKKIMDLNEYLKNKSASNAEKEI